MNALTLFLASFIVVFALGFQQLNVSASLYRAAFGTSLLIGTSQLVLFKVLPGPTSTLEVLAFLLGGATGIVAAMRAHPLFVAWRAAGDDAVRTAIEDLHAGDDGIRLHQAAHRAERAELEADLALEHAREVISGECPRLTMGRADWYDLANPIGSQGEWLAGVDLDVRCAARYLDLREQLIHHPTVHSLVRFPS